MSISYSSVTLTDCMFNNNNSSYNGGGAINISNQSILTIINCTFSNNSGVSGGAIDVSYSSFTITNSTFSNNKSGSNGGAIYFNSEESSVVTNCSFVGCKASDNGGAIYTIYEGSPLFLTNCTFINDTATSGGACFNYLGARTFYTNCTFVSNVATSFGGAIYNRAYVSKDSVKSTFINCLFWSNNAPEGSQLYLGEYTSPRLYNCLIEGGYSGHGIVSNIITEDPLLGTFGDHGGAVFTIPIDALSPARNAGTTEMVPPEVDISTDARGYPRSDGAPDIGAYEVQ